MRQNLSHKIIKKGDFDTSVITEFTHEFKNQQGQTVEETKKVPTFALNKQHAEKVKIFRDSQVNAEKIISDAKLKAKEVVENARIEAERLKQDSINNGYTEGKDRAKNESTQFVNAVVNNLNSIINELTLYKPTAIKEAESDIIQLVFEVVEKVILTKLDKDDEIVLRIVHDAIKNLSDRETLTIRVNREDIEVLKREKVNLIQELDGIKRLTIVEDESIKRGGCYIESATSDVDARIDKQIEAVKSSLENI